MAGMRELSVISQVLPCIWIQEGCRSWDLLARGSGGAGGVAALLLGTGRGDARLGWDAISCIPSLGTGGVLSSLSY